MRSRNSQGIHRLSAAAIKHISESGWHGDGGGLFLEVDRNGRKRWAMRLTINGKRRDFGLGPIHKVSLAEARERAAEYRSKAHRGIDPSANRRVVAPSPASLTFQEAAYRVYDQRRLEWRNGKHVEQWINSLCDYAFPFIGSTPVNEIATPEILQVLAPIWSSKPETARRVKQRLAIILDWARAAGHRSGDNPTRLLNDALPKHSRADRHHPALPYVEVPDFIAKLRLGNAESITKLAFEFLILTATRTADVRSARWDELDRNVATWTIPGQDAATGRRMKSGRDHVVPLSRRCVGILAEAKVGSASEFIFPDIHTGRIMSENRFLVVRDGLGYDKGTCTPHGFRSSFRDWAAEETGFPPEVAEMALAHAIKNKVEAAYRRGHLLAKRRELMAAWAEFCTPATKCSSCVGPLEEADLKRLHSS